MLSVALSTSLPGEEIEFERDIAPILRARCVRCHGAEGHIAGGLDLTEARTAFLRADSGERAIVAGDRDAGSLWRRVRSRDADERMPPQDEPQLTQQQIRLLGRWIQSGASWPTENTPRHWAYQPPTLRPPARYASNWSRNPIDDYVLAGMQSKKLQPSPQADPARLLRRLYLDLVGVPPTVDEVNRFLSNPSDLAYRQTVDRLLSSPQYGEKWARQWLDLARYSDSNGYQADQIRELWAFRDWVIAAMNKDMPFDQFTIDQLAGDMLPHATFDQRVATGFHRATTCNVEAGVDPEENRTNQVFDRVNTTGTAWLAMTLECAQCHNHKYDPISQQEYYEFFAFFNNTPLEVKQENKNSVQFNFGGPELELPQDKETARTRQELQARIQSLRRREKRLVKAKNEEEQKLKTIAADVKRIQQQLDRLRPSTTMVMQELEERRTTKMFLRGSFLTPGSTVTANVPTALNPFPADAPKNRLGFARWLVSAENPLTARVAVNRWWHELFGRGIVASINDFGSQGELPTHPELLDWLAIELRGADWSMKHIHRLIVSSSTYRQTARVPDAQRHRDPENRWLARGPRNRLPAELIRDNALAVSGLLMNRMEGPPIFPPQPAGLWRQTGRNEPVFQTAIDENRHRRGIYVVWRRAAPYPSFIAFDAPDRMTCVACRPNTNTPLQALALLNDEVYVETAKAMAIRVMRESSTGSLSSQLEYAVKLVLARPPTPHELDVLKELFQRELAAYQDDPNLVEQLQAESTHIGLQLPAETVRWAAWFSVCNALLNLDETISK